MSIGTMHETDPLLDDSQPGGEARSQTKVPEVEIHLFLTGRGLDPIDVFKWKLGGEEQNQLDVLPILDNDKYGLKTIFAFTVDNGVCVPIRFRNVRSLLTFRDGAVVYIIGTPKPKNPAIETIKRIVFGTVFATLFKMFLVWITPAWIKNNFSPWEAVCIIIVASLASKSSRDLFRDFGRLYHRS